VRFTIVVRKHHGRSNRSRHHGDYISASTKSASIAVGSAAPVIVGLTPTSKGCSTTTPLTCTVAFSVLPGSRTFTVTLFDGLNATGKQLSVGTATETIAAGKVNAISVVCNGVVASLALSLSQPSPTIGLAQTIPLAVTALDADGNTIIAPGEYENGPITLTDSDATYTTLQVGTATPAQSVAVNGPADVVNVAYIGGGHLTSATFTASITNAPSVGTATAVLTPVPPQVSIDAGTVGSAISPDMVGANLPAWTDNTQSYQATAMKTAGLHLIRWPGGSFADDYHWAGTAFASPGSTLSPSACEGAYFDPDSTFDNMMTYAANPASLDVAITLNYGTNAACTGPGTPTEAKDWAAYAVGKGYNVKYWTIGNENYGPWETDMHASPQSPSTYVAAVTGASGYYAKVKAADPSSKVGIVASGPGYYSAWDQTVLPGALGSYDFVEYHYYAQQGVGAGSAPGDAESDSYLLGQGIDDFGTALDGLRAELTSAGAASTLPIYLGELNSIVGTAGKQTTSITNALFAGMAMGEAIKRPGVSMATWWLAFGDCETVASGGNFDSSLYGWQNFGTYTLFSDQSSGCGSEDTVTAGTAFPDGVAFNLLSQFVGSGSTNRTVTSTVSTTNARFYADAIGTGYGILLFNLNETEPVTYSVALTNTSVSQFTATQTYYDKAQYDLTNQANPVWSGASAPVSLGTVGPIFTVTLQPWSMNLVTLSPVTPSGRRHSAAKAAH
jgi:hypothetical protein